jgi:hypothetical protein
MMLRMSVALSAFVGLSSLLGCTSVVLQLRPPPRLPGLPTAPSVPESQSVRGEVAPTVDARVVSARLPGDLRAQTVAIAVEGDEQIAGTLTPRFTRALLAAGYTRVLYPTSVQAVNGELERVGTTAGERTVIHGTVRQLLPLRATTPADSLLAISVQPAGVVERERRVEARYADGALAAYDREYQQFSRAARGLSGLIAGYTSESEEAFASYQRAGGVVRANTPEAQLAYAVEAWTATATSLQGQLRALLANVPPTAQLAARAAAATAGGTERVSMPVVRLRATLTDLRAGETYWMVDVNAEGTDQSAALEGAVASILTALGNRGGAPAAAAAPTP